MSCRLFHSFLYTTPPSYGYNSKVHSDIFKVKGSERVGLSFLKHVVGVSGWGSEIDVIQYKVRWPPSNRYDSMILDDIRYSFGGHQIGRFLQVKG